MAELTGASTVPDRKQCVARATNDAGMDQMRDALLHSLELDDYLDGQAIPSSTFTPGREAERKQKRLGAAFAGTSERPA